MSAAGTDRPRDLPLAPCRLTGDEVAAIRDALGIWCRERKSQRALAAVAAAVAFSPRGRSLSYSRSSRWYDEHAADNPLITYRLVVGSVATLAAARLIEHWPQAPGVRGMQSRMASTEALREIVQFALGAAWRPRVVRGPLIELRRKVGSASVRIDFPITAETVAMEHEIMELQTFTDSIAITGPHFGGGPGVSLFRCFTDDTAHGGRVYHRFGGPLCLPAEQRDELRFDGEETLELDHPNLHPRLLYASVGSLPPADCYDLPGWPRKLAKIALNIAINAEDRAATVGAIILHREMRRLLLDAEDFERCERAHAPAHYVHRLRPDFARAARQEATRLLDALTELHQPIAGFLCSGAGLILQNIDSRMALRVMGAAVRAGVPIIGLHDGFRVPVSRADFLSDAMADAADFGAREARFRLSA